MTQISTSILTETFHQYFTESCKIFIAFSTNTDVQNEETIRRYFTESCKIFIAFATITDDLWPSVFYRELQNIYCPCHNHRHYFQRIFCQYNIIEVCATVKYTDGILVRNSKYTDGNLMPPP